MVFVPLDQADARDDLLVDLVDAGKLDTDGAEVVRAVLDTMESDMVAARREFVDSHGDAEWGRQDVLSLRIDLTLVAADAAATLEGLVDDPLAERLDGTALDPETYLDLAMPLKIRVEP